MPTFNTGHAIAGNMDTADTVPGLLGELRVANTGMYRYGKASVALTAGDLCKFTADGNFTADKDTDTTTLGTTVPKLLGVPQVDIPLGSYGWFFVGHGTFNLKVAAGVAAAAKLTTTATDGTAGAGGTYLGAYTIGNTTGGAAVISCFAHGMLGTTLYT